jgi:hypothetical protein
VRSIEKEIQDLCDLVRGNTYEGFMQKVRVINRIPRQDGTIIDFDYKLLTATAFNEEYVSGMVDFWDEEGMWVWSSQIKERVYFKKD